MKTFAERGPAARLCRQIATAIVLLTISSLVAQAAATPDPNGTPSRKPRSAPLQVKGVYMSFYAIGHRGLRTSIQSLLETTELNAVVIDVKGDRGFIPYRSKVDLAHKIGAQNEIMMKDWDGFMRWFKERNVYTIARIVVFKDNPLANAHPEWAVKDSRTGKPWHDSEDLAWADPFREEVIDYNVAVAVEAAKQGFDEIQFDYVRFPTDGEVSAVQFAKEATPEARRDAIIGLLKRMRTALKPYGIKVAADIFGYTSWRDDDTGIGQKIEEMAPFVDVLCPMLYPSGFHAGIPKYRLAVPHPYEIVHYSTKKALSRLKGTSVEIRPWLQDFRDYAYDKRKYTAKEIRAQMQGALEAGASGWMLWNPRVQYTRSALLSQENADD
jgi:hypothetical protein